MMPSTTTTEQPNTSMLHDYVMIMNNASTTQEDKESELAETIRQYFRKHPRANSGS